MDEGKQGNKKALAIVGLLVIVAAIAVGVMVSSGSKTSDTTPTPSSTVQSQQTENPAATNSNYKDGTYSATGNYTSPGGREKITISLTLSGGAITDTSATSGSSNPTGQEFQSKFISGYKSLVVGKSIDEVNVSRVSGSSLTSRGFNDALEQIKSQAKS